MNITPQDDTSKAKSEEARYRKDLKVAKFELVDSFQAALCRQYPDPDSDAFLTEKAWNANATRICNASNTRRDYKRKYGRNCLSKEGPIPSKTR